MSTFHHPLVQAATAPMSQPMTAQQIGLIEILLDPDLDQAGYFSGSTPDEILEDMLEQYDRFGANPDSADWAQESQRIADTLRSYYESLRLTDPDEPEFTFNFECNADGEICGFSIGAYLTEVNAYLTTFHDEKYLYSRGQSGLDYALSVAELLLGEYTQVLNKITKHVVTDIDGAIAAAGDLDDLNDHWRSTR